MMLPERLRAIPRTPVATKVPAIGVAFWIVKVLTTGTGEAASDWLGGLEPVVAAGLVLLALCAFVAAMWGQFRSTSYVAPVYWSAVVMVALFGTVAADVLHVGLMLPYAVTTLLYSVAVGLLFRAWHRSEGTLSIHSITTTRREVYYWLTVVATFALGTAVGDLTAVSLRLGYFPSAILFAAAIALPLVGWWRFRLDAVVAFWSAYVLTRPLGASIADGIGKPHALSGMNVGDGTVTLAGLLAIVAGVALMASTSPHQAGPDQAGPHQAGPHQAGPHQAGPDQAGSDRRPHQEAADARS